MPLGVVTALSWRGEVSLGGILVIISNTKGWFGSGWGVFR